ncbi:MAG TPA: hypothetical protein P5089_03335 [Candidatus Portnoybacteria bacterium]|nr:hypothetical protein [Candidatus Portnoybacteria bacterium]
MKKWLAFSVVAIIAFSLLTVPVLAADKEVAAFIEDSRLYQEKISEAFDSLQFPVYDVDTENSLSGLFCLLEYSSENLLNEIEKMNNKGYSRAAMAKFMDQSMELFYQELKLLFIIHMRYEDPAIPDTEKKIKNKITF